MDLQSLVTISNKGISLKPHHQNLGSPMFLNALNNWLIETLNARCTNLGIRTESDNPSDWCNLEEYLSWMAVIYIRFNNLNKSSESPSPRTMNLSELVNAMDTVVSRYIPLNSVYRSLAPEVRTNQVVRKLDENWMYMVTNIFKLVDPNFRELSRASKSNKRKLNPNKNTENLNMDDILKQRAVQDLNLSSNAPTLGNFCNPCESQPVDYYD